MTSGQLRLLVHGVGMAVVLAIVATGYMISFSSTEDQAAVWNTSIEANASLLKQRQSIQETRDQTETELAEMSQRLDDLTAMIPTSPEESRFLAQLAALAREADLNIRNFRPGPAEETHNVNQI